jgi:iron complex outermembrane receptor protein
VANAGTCEGRLRTFRTGVCVTDFGSNRARRLLCGGAFLTAAWAGPGFADAPADQAGLESIVVTAERRQETDKEVPESVTALTSLELDNLAAGGADIRFLSDRVPSLEIESSFGRTFPRFYIRGLGNSDFDLNASQPVSIVYNDVVEENPILKGFPIFDVDQVEVLRGPQGTLFGRNTPAGVVKVDSVKPSDETQGYVEAAYGRFNELDLDGAVGGAIVPGKLDFRASFYLAREDDWVHNTFVDPIRQDLNGFVDGAGRFQLLFKPTDDITALWDVHFRILDGTADLFYANAIQKGTDHLIAGFNPDTISQNGGNYQRLHTFGSALTLTDVLSQVTLTSVTGFERGYVASRGDVDGGDPTDTPFGVDTSDSIPLLDQLTQEFRYTSNDWGRWSNIGGIFYFHETAHINDYDYGNDEPYGPPYGEGSLDGTAYQKQDTDSLGIYETAKYKISDAWSVGGGLRWSYDAKDYSVNVTQSAAFPPGPPVQFHTSPSSDNLSWDVNSTYALDENVSAYGRIATGYRGPSIQGRVLSENPALISQASPEKTISYEAGLKTEFADHKIRWDIDGFDWVTHDLQLTATGGAGNFTELVNAKQAQGWGFETDLQVKPIPPLLLSVTGSYNHTAIQDPNLAVAACGAPCTVTDPTYVNNGVTLARLNGNALPHAPQWVLDWRARYSIPFENGTEAYLDTDWSYRSSINLLLYTSKEFTGAPLLLGGVRVGFIDPAQNWEISAYVRNITNDIQLTGAIDFDNFTALVNDPRTYGVQLRYTF